jgi:hypothetical protein
VAVAALSDPYGVQEARVLPAADGRDVDPEEIGNLANSE